MISKFDLISNELTKLTFKMELDHEHMIADDKENSRLEQLVRIQTEAKELFKRKNTDYGDAFAEYGTIGILVRLGDKIKRLQSISTRSITLVEDEKLRDTLIDLHNYSAMGIMILDENRDTGSFLETNDTKNHKNMGESSSLPQFCVSVENWEIYGDSGDIYERKRFTNNKTGEITESCTCNSFIFCKADTKTCKHIKKKYKMAP